MVKLRYISQISGVDPDPQQFEDDKPKCMKYEPILTLFQGFEPLLEARIWIRSRISIKMKSRIRIRIRIRIHIRIRVISRIRVRIRFHIKVMLIHNTVSNRHDFGL